MVHKTLVTVGVGFVLGCLLFVWAGFIMQGVLTARRQNAVASSVEDPGSPPTAEGPTGVVGTVTAEESIPIGDGTVAMGLFATHADDYSKAELAGEAKRQETHAVPFGVRTDGGTVPVAASEELSVEGLDGRTRDETFQGDERLPTEIEDVNEFLGSPPFPDDHERHYDMDWVEVGDEVFVYGTAKREDGEMAITGDGDRFFVANGTPEDLLEERRHDLRRETAKAAGWALIGLVLVGGTLSLYLFA